MLVRLKIISFEYCIPILLTIACTAGYFTLNILLFPCYRKYGYYHAHQEKQKQA
jgi:hypothetical protein